jgi:hypothetical protein
MSSALSASHRVFSIIKGEFSIPKLVYSTTNIGFLNTPKDVGFEVLTAVVMKSTIFWDITLCSPLSVNQRFGGTYRLHLHAASTLVFC